MVESKEALSESSWEKMSDSSWEKKGGYVSPETPVRRLPVVPDGPAPGADEPGSTDGNPQPEQPTN